MSAHATVQSKDGDTAQSSKTLKATFAVQTPLRMDESGRMIDTAQLLKSHGLVVGMYISKQVGDDKKYGILQAIEQDEITVYCLGKGQIKQEVFPAKDFAKTWSLVMDAKEVEDAGSVPSWPLLGPNTDLDFLTDMRKASYKAALYTVWNHFQQVQGDPTIMVNSKPRKHVVATSDIPERSLVLVPFSTSLSFFKQGECKQSQAIPVASVISPKDDEQVLHIYPYISMPSPAKANSGRLVPFWAVDRLDKSMLDEEKVNCEMALYRHSLAIVLPAMASHLPRHEQERLVIPVLVNTKPIAKGTRLVWCDSGLEVSEKPEKPLKAPKGKMKAPTTAAEKNKKRKAQDLLGPEAAAEADK